MAAYIVRRLLLMIPTLIGITFLVFMLVALSPGGIGAALRAAGGSMSSEGSASRAQQEAYLEDRYGLNAPAALQYVRWLARISPIKFGQRAQQLPSGEIVSTPRHIELPPLWTWFVAALPTTVPAQIETGLAAQDEDARLRTFKTAANIYARTRAEYVGKRAEFLQTLGTYFKATDRRNLVDYKGNPDLGDLAKLPVPEATDANFAPVTKEGAALVAAYGQAEQARVQLDALTNETLFAQVGVPIVPGVLSIAWPDLGQSFTRGRPVLDMIGTALPVTLLINLIAFPIIYFIAVPCGLLMAVRQGRWQDVTLGSLVVGLWSVPVVWAAVLAQGYLANNQHLGWFPVGSLHHNTSDGMTFLPSLDSDGSWSRGYVLDMLWHVVLPVTCLVYGGFAILSKQTRAAMLENFSADYVRTAKAKGVSPGDVVVKHVLRNSLLPLITMFASIFPAMLAGSVIIERIFSIPGMGSMIIESIYLRDREVLLANTLMIAAVNLLALLLADILYALADPRISYK